MAQQLRLDSAKKFEKVLRQLPKKLREREMVSAARADAYVIRKEIRERAPRGSDPLAASKRYGSLHDDIRAARIKTE